MNDDQHNTLLNAATGAAFKYDEILVHQPSQKFVLMRTRCPQDRNRVSVLFHGQTTTTIVQESEPEVPHIAEGNNTVCG